MGRCGKVRRSSAISRVIAVVWPGIFLGILLVSFFGLSATGLTAWLAAASPDALARQAVCVRPEPGSAVPEPVELRSHDGILETDLRILDQKLPDGTGVPIHGSARVKTHNDLDDALYSASQMLKARGPIPSYITAARISRSIARTNP